MVVDCGNIIVNVMDAEAREVFALESFYEGMTAGEDPYAGMSYDVRHPPWPLGPPPQLLALACRARAGVARGEPRAPQVDCEAPAGRGGA